MNIEGARDDRGGSRDTGEAGRRRAGGPRSLLGLREGQDEAAGKRWNQDLLSRGGWPPPPTPLPRKSTVEPKAAFLRLAGLLGPAPPSSRSGDSDALDPELRGSLCTSGPLSAVGGDFSSPRRRAFPPRFPPQGEPGPPALPPHLATAAARTRSLPELQQASGPSRGWGFGSHTHTPSAFVAVSPRTTPSVPRLPRPGG